MELVSRLLGVEIGLKSAHDSLADQLRQGIEVVLVGLNQCVHIGLAVLRANDRHGQARPQQNEILPQPRHPAVPVLERMDPSDCPVHPRRQHKSVGSSLSARMREYLVDEV